MSTKLGRMVTNLQRLLPRILLYPLVACSREIIWQTKNISTNRMPLTTKLCKGYDVPWEDPTHKVTWPLNHVILQNHVTNWRHYISTTMMPVTTKLGRGATYHEGLPIKSHAYIITWSCEISWQTKIVSLRQCLWLPNFGRVSIYTEKLPYINSHNPLIMWSREILDLLYLYYSKGCYHQTWWLTIRNFHPQSYRALWTRAHVRLCNEFKTLLPPPECLWLPNLVALLPPVRSFPPQNQKTLCPGGLAKSRDRLTMLYFHYHNDYGYQIWLGGSIYWRPSLDKVVTSLDYVVLQGHVAYLLYHKIFGH